MRPDRGPTKVPQAISTLTSLLSSSFPPLFSEAKNLVGENFEKPYHIVDLKRTPVIVGPFWPFLPKWTGIPGPVSF